MSEVNPLPFFARADLTTESHSVVCRALTTEDELRLGWRAIRLLRLLESVPIIP